RAGKGDKLVAGCTAGSEGGGEIGTRVVGGVLHDGGQRRWELGLGRMAGCAMESGGRVSTTRGGDAVYDQD
ncbi:hypothetical protein E2562_034436, partial [Oryza meyeriana var. granulata]